MKAKLIGKYTIKVEDVEGKIRITRTCQGITSLELLGHLAIAQKEIMEQIQGIFKPDIIKRRIVK